MIEVKEFKNFVQEIRDTVENSSSIEEFFVDEEDLRSKEDALYLFDRLSPIILSLYEFQYQFPHFEIVVKKAYGDLKVFEDGDYWLEMLFLGDCLFLENDQMGFIIDNKISLNLCESYSKEVDYWQTQTEQAHDKNQELLKTNFDFSKPEKAMDCRCTKCVADYRTKLRDSYVFKIKDLIENQYEVISEKALHLNLSQTIDMLSKLNKKVDKELNTVRQKFKRSSFNKIKKTIEKFYEQKFDIQSDFGVFYQEKLKAYFNGMLTEQDLNPAVIDETDYRKFFKNMGRKIWRSLPVVRREFEKFVGSVLTLKRTDVSSTILNEYLGQFWLYAAARRKNRKFIYHMGPTNSGKTYHAIEALCAAKSGCYLAPLRLLAGELYDKMNSKGVKTTLLTGEEVIDTPDASHYSSTIEMARISDEFECCVIDEIQMITDKQRGWAWTRALVNLNSDEVHLCGDPSVLELVREILELTGDTLEVKEYTRMTELNVQPNKIKLSELTRSDALIVFSRRNALKYKRDLEKLGYKVSIIYGRLSPEVRREQARKFDVGETDIIVSTDAIAMGMNLPVKRIVFSTLSKHYNNQEHFLTHSEIKQIAGRAGRFQRFPTGFVTTLERVEDGLELVHEALTSKLDQKEQAMVGPDLDIYKLVNDALTDKTLPELTLPEFLRLFNTMDFRDPFVCVELTEMIEVAEMVEATDPDRTLSNAEIFGFSCAPVNLGLNDHVDYFMAIVSKYVKSMSIERLSIDSISNNIDYLETSIKCVELYQWLSRHFENKNFVYEQSELEENKGDAVEKLNTLLSEKIKRTCSSCGVNLRDDFKFNICETCFDKRFRRGPSKPKFSKKSDGKKKIRRRRKK